MNGNKIRKFEKPMDQWDVDFFIFLFEWCEAIDLEDWSNLTNCPTHTVSNQQPNTPYNNGYTTSYPTLLLDTIKGHRKELL